MVRFLREKKWRCSDFNLYAECCRQREGGGGRGGGGEGQGQFVLGPQCIQIRPGSSVTFQSSFFKGFVSLYFRLKSVCFFASHFMLLMQTSSQIASVQTSGIFICSRVVTSGLKMVSMKVHSFSDVFPLLKDSRRTRCAILR